MLPRMRRLDEDPLLSDHPYGASTARRPPPTSHDPTQDPLLSDHPYGSPTGGRPPPTSFRDYDSDLWPQLRSHHYEISQRERRVQHLLMRFRHSQDSSFVEVNRGPSTEVYANPERSATSEANERYREVRERRLARQMARRQLLLDRIINQQNRGGQNEATASSEARSRPIDEWAIHLRLQQQQNSRDSYLRFLREQPSTDDNDDNDSVTAQFGDFQDERPPRGPLPPPASMAPVEPTVTARPLSTIDANMIRPQGAEESANNDHNYTLSPAGSSTTTSATTSPTAGTSGTAQTRAR